jgi:hypothetical protein
MKGRQGRQRCSWKHGSNLHQRERHDAHGLTAALSFRGHLASHAHRTPHASAASPLTRAALLQQQQQQTQHCDAPSLSRCPHTPPALCAAMHSARRAHKAPHHTASTGGHSALAGPHTGSRPRPGGRSHAEERLATTIGPHAVNLTASTCAQASASTCMRPSSAQTRATAAASRTALAGRCRPTHFYESSINYQHQQVARHTNGRQVTARHTQAWGNAPPLAGARKAVSQAKGRQGRQQCMQQEQRKDGRCLPQSNSTTPLVQTHPHHAFAVSGYLGMHVRQPCMLAMPGRLPPTKHAA